MSIPSSFIDQILDQSDIVDIIGRRVQLNKKAIIFGVFVLFMMTPTLQWQ